MISLMKAEAQGLEATWGCQGIAAGVEGQAGWEGMFLEVGGGYPSPEAKVGVKEVGGGRSLEVGQE